MIKNNDTKELLKRTKSIWNKPGIRQWQDWVIISENKIIGRNGYTNFLYLSDDESIKDTPPCMVQATNLINFLDTTDDELEIKTEENSVKMRNKKKIVSYNYPCTFDDFIKDSTLIDTTLEYTECDLQDLTYNFETIFKDNKDFCNIFVKKGKAYSTNGKIITVTKTKLPDTDIPFTMQEFIPTAESVFVDSNYIIVNEGGLFVLGFRIDAVARKVLGIVPREFNTDYKITFPDNTKEIVRTLKKMNTEYRKSDGLVCVHVSGSTIKMALANAKNIKYVEEFESPEEALEEMTFNVDPDALLKGLELSTEFYYNDRFLYVKNDKAERFIAIE